MHSWWMLTTKRSCGESIAPQHFDRIIAIEYISKIVEYDVEKPKDDLPPDQFTKDFEKAVCNYLGTK